MENKAVGNYQTIRLANAWASIQGIRSLQRIRPLNQSCALALLLCTLAACTAPKNAPADAKAVSTGATEIQIAKENETPKVEVESVCVNHLNKIKGRDDAQVAQICRESRVLEGCKSVLGTPIYHFDRLSQNPKGKRILAFALIHGDEGPSGAVARAWMERLSRIDPQNHWRIVPVLNPDGWEKRSRVNANKIDLNRNFPTKNWKQESKRRWEIAESKDPRRFPGTEPASEPETRCAMTHIDDFQPNFIISVHTPFGVLDFDGPRIKFPEYADLPWFSLGNFPGSMGRYMWGERKVPVLTIELKGNDYAHRLDQFDRLQDVTGIVAIQAEKSMERGSGKSKSAATPDSKMLTYSEDAAQDRILKTSRIR